uniref:flippase n=1 Tax=Agathobacter sp. TaxID=2021311 RepID=UPI004056FDF5
MAKTKSIKLNFIMNIILTMSNFIFPFITFPYICRVLEPIGYGKVSSAVAFINIFNMFAQLGIPTYGVRACAKVRDDKEKLTRVAHELLIINLIMNVFVYIALFGAIMFLPEIREEKTLYFIVSSTILLTSIGMEWIYKALEQYTYITVRSLVFKVVALVFMFLFVREQSDYIIYGGITIFAASASNIFNLINVRKYIDLKPVGGYEFGKHIKAVAIFFAMACATTIYTNLDSVMLKFMTSDTEVGYYNAAVKLKGILVSIVTSLGTVLLPRATYYVENGLVDEFKRISTKALNFVFLFSTPIMVFFIIFAREGILFFSGEDYLTSVPAMQIIMPTLLLIGITNILGIQILIPLGKEKVVLWSEIAGAIVDIIANAILIPHFASAGAAMGTLLAEFVVFVVQFAVLKEQMKDAFGKIHYLHILSGVLIGLALVCWLKMVSLSTFITLVMGAALFFGGYGVYMLAVKETLIIEVWNVCLGKIKKVLGK